ncbi:LysR family transcriptional regulator [Proteus terrae]|uniref:LysR family transcriptional regulator n=3 Tax=Proteus terrae TaxID=1574161 RepID=A0A6G6T195_9GAMM|nr:LysR family transcriptional regulator [Proteus terrae]MBG2914073.1 LysR family transcriptional regulator [Proteus terrae subsp. cibarius]MBG3090495.1 LysR family transcriptional regulator [Proteus terrae subsp. cibarius]MCO4180361.1 LysR family transcriptional regulator [Proteus terrae]MCO4190135.1 LysR family transcriptional regulator [Proteus terrae]QHD94114.1 LysR family transcriptional regulator [Proteus terrae subsp. cibarius]
MDTRLLNAFVVLAETEHFGEASSRLFISQPALTKQIKTLESQLGVTLFQRGRHGAKLTPEGQYLLSQSQSVLREARILEKQARQLSAPQKVELYAGFGLSSLNFITPLLAKFNRVHPDITVHIDDMPSNTMEDKLLLGELDLAFSRLPVTEPLKSISLVQERLMLAIPTQTIMVLEADDDPLHYFNTLGLIQLSPEKGKKLYQQIHDFLKHHQIKPRVLQQSQDIQTQLALVAAGLGMALVPKSAELICDKQKVTLLPLSGLYTQWEIGVIWNNNIQNKDRDIFIKIISEEINKI